MVSGVDACSEQAREARVHPKAHIMMAHQLIRTQSMIRHEPKDIHSHGSHRIERSLHCSTQPKLCLLHLGGQRGIQATRQPDEVSLSPTHHREHLKTNVRLTDLGRSLKGTGN